MKYTLQQYLQSHIADRRYSDEPAHLPGMKIYQNKFGWKDYLLGNNLIYSHRETTYDMSVFPERLHSHPFFEMDIYISGMISYISDNQEIIPVRGSVLLFPPQVMHTAHLSEKSKYERYVFYFTPQFFYAFGADLLPLLSKMKTACLEILPEAQGMFYYYLNKIQYISETRTDETVLAMNACILQFFVLLSEKGRQNSKSVYHLPQNIVQIKSYIDDNLQTISTVGEISAHFHYSREYLSRLFRQYYNINISEYITRQKISAAKKALESGSRVTEAFQLSGYHTMSSFISAFKKFVNMTPSEYRKRISDT
jgi:AraC-like DNA-binding protein